MKVLKFILPLCLLLPSSVIISQKVEAQIKCNQCQRPPDPLAACRATAKFSTCQTYHKMWCVYGQSMGLSESFRRGACAIFNLSRSNPGYYQQLITANKSCTGGNQTACNWLKQQRGLD